MAITFTQTSIQNTFSATLTNTATGVPFLQNVKYAYSTRKLNPNYAGACMKVRRDSDSTTSNVGFFANGDLDTTTLLNFVGEANGYITEWYDQVGTAHANNATAAQQPRVVYAGDLEVLNSKPCIYFANSSHSLYIAGTNNTPIMYTNYFIVYANESNAASRAILGTPSAGGLSMTVNTSRQVLMLRQQAATVLTGSVALENGTAYVIEQQITPTNKFAQWIDGAVSNSGTVSSVSFVAQTSSRIGVSGSTTGLGRFAEWIVYESASPIPNRAYVRAYMKNYWGTA